MLFQSVLLSLLAFIHPFSQKNRGTALGSGKLNQELETIAAKRAAANEEFDKKETSVKGKIAALEQKKKDILAPKPPRKPRKTKKQKIQDLIKSASSS